MPHILIEHSANLSEIIDISVLVDTVHAAALEDGLAALDALRTRAESRRHFRIADGRPEYAFVAVTARIGRGRSTAEQQRFLTALVDTVDRLLEPVVETHPVALSVELQEIDPERRVNRNHVRRAMNERT